MPAGLKLVGTSAASPHTRAGSTTAVDLCGNEVVGYTIAAHMRAGLAVEAISAADRTGLVPGNAIMGTDRGSQYHSKKYKTVLRRLEIRQSTTRTGSCPDGAAAESFFATIAEMTTYGHLPSTSASSAVCRSRQSSGSGI